MENEIIECNILIGEFMGKFDFSKAYCRSHGLPEYKPEEDLVEVQTFKYHSSWDWLMPVVEKIDQEATKDSLSLSIEKLSIFAEIGEVWKAVIEFINWYNQNKS